MSGEDMITFDKDGVRFVVRSAGIALRGNHVLLHRSPDEDFWSLPGGRCELNEATNDALRREMQEELGIDVQVERLLWVVENFFEYDGRNCHEIGFYYLMSIADQSPLHDRGDEFLGDEFGLPLIFKWHDMQELDSLAVYPVFLRKGLRSLPHTVAHVVHIDEKQSDEPLRIGSVTGN
jgi:8-oxo-dGTP pyrophosphatase MutT (NUDIX family)